jgi:DNA-binding CsgD family transcriptional regulator
MADSADTAAIAAAAKLEHKRALARARSKRMYERRKDEILKKREETRAANETATIEHYLKLLKEKSLSDKTIKLHEGNIKILKTLIDCTYITTCFKNHKKVIKAINEAIQTNRKPHGPYSPSTKVRLFGVILSIIDTLKLDIDKKPYETEMKVYDLDSRKETAARQDETVMTFDNYLPLVLDKFGKNSKEYIIASLYALQPFRDDLQLKIIRFSKDATDPDTNYIIIKKNHSIIRLILNQYKTDKKFGSYNINLDMKLSTSIYAYLYDKTNSDVIPWGDYLFSDKANSGFISKFNKELGLNITSNTYRRMHVSAHDIDEMTSRERVELANKMKHSPTTSQVYRRKIIVNPDELD